MELTNQGRIDEWIIADKDGVRNAEWVIKHNYDAVKKREQYIAKIKQVEPNYEPPAFKLPEKSYAGYIILFLIVVGICFYYYTQSNSQKNQASQSSTTSTTNQTAKVSAQNGVNIRSEASSSASILTVAPLNDIVTIIDANGPSETISGQTANWIKVEYNGTTGWVWGGLLQTQ